MKKTVKMFLKRTFRRWANGQNIYDFFEKENDHRGYSDPVLVLTLSWGYIHICI